MHIRWLNALAVVMLAAFVMGAQTPTSAEVVSVAWSPDGTRIAGGGNNGLLRIWDANGQTRRTMPAYSGYVYSMAWSPDSTKIVTGHEDANARIWDASTGQLLATLIGHNDDMRSVDWSPDNLQIATSSFYESNNLRVWGASNYQILSVRQSGTIFELSWSPDSNKLLAALENGYVGVYDIALGDPVGPFVADSANLTADWCPDGTQFAGGNIDGQIYIFDAITYAPITTLTGHTDQVDAIAYRPNGVHLASASNDGTIRIWDVASGETVKIITRPVPVLFTTSIAWSPDGNQIAFGGDAGNVIIVDVPASLP